MSWSRDFQDLHLVDHSVIFRQLFSALYERRSLMEAARRYTYGLEIYDFIPLGSKSYLVYNKYNDPVNKCFKGFTQYLRPTNNAIWHNFTCPGKSVDYYFQHKLLTLEEINQLIGEEFLPWDFYDNVDARCKPINEVLTINYALNRKKVLNILYKFCGQDPQNFSKNLVFIGKKMERYSYYKSLQKYYSQFLVPIAYEQSESHTFLSYEDDSSFNQITLTQQGQCLKTWGYNSAQGYQIFTATDIKARLCTNYPISFKAYYKGLDFKAQIYLYSCGRQSSDPYGFNTTPQTRARNPLDLSVSGQTGTLNIVNSYNYVQAGPAGYYDDYYYDLFDTGYSPSTHFLMFQKYVTDQDKSEKFIQYYMPGFQYYTSDTQENLDRFVNQVFHNLDATSLGWMPGVPTNQEFPDYGDDTIWAATNIIRKTFSTFPNSGYIFHVQLYDYSSSLVYFDPLSGNNQS